MHELEPKVGYGQKKVKSSRRRGRNAKQRPNERTNDPNGKRRADDKQHPAPTHRTGPDATNALTYDICMCAARGGVGKEEYLHTLEPLSRYFFVDVVVLVVVAGGACFRTGLTELQLQVVGDACGKRIRTAHVTCTSTPARDKQTRHGERTKTNRPPLLAAALRTPHLTPNAKGDQR